MTELYRIRNWPDIYEVNRTRELKKLTWIALPIKLHGHGYAYLMEQKEGAAIFGCFIALVEIAADCTPRGTLLRGTSMPHTEESLARQSRMPLRLLRTTLRFCTTPDMMWLEIIDLESGAVIPHEDATIPQADALRRVRTEKTDKQTAKPSLIKSLEEPLKTAVDEWIKMRVQKKEPPTEHAIKLALKEAANATGRDQPKMAALFDKSTLNGWKGIFPDKEKASGYTEPPTAEFTQ